MSDMWTQIEQIGIIPVITIDQVEHASGLGAALCNAGLMCAEITCRTPAAVGAIETLSAQFSDLLIGAGTVLTLEQAQQVVDAGARFIVSPGFDAEIVEWCTQRGIPIIPGTATPTEVMMAIKHGLKLVKFFPAEAVGGVKVLKAISEPFSSMRFIPTGGISPANLADYLRLPSVMACGGSWMVKRELIAEGRFDEIRRLAEEAVSMVQQIRGKTI